MLGNLLQRLFMKINDFTVCENGKKSLYEEKRMSAFDGHHRQKLSCFQKECSKFNFLLKPLQCENQPNTQPTIKWNYFFSPAIINFHQLYSNSSYTFCVSSVDLQSSKIVNYLFEMMWMNLISSSKWLKIDGILVNWGCDASIQPITVV